MHIYLVYTIVYSVGLHGIIILAWFIGGLKNYAEIFLAVALTSL